MFQRPRWTRHTRGQGIRCPPCAFVLLDAAAQLANDPTVQGEAWRVFLLLLSLMDDDNRIVVHNSKLAGYLQMHRQGVSRGLTTLARVGCVRRDTTGTGCQVSTQVASRYLVT